MFDIGLQFDYSKNSGERGLLKNTMVVAMGEFGRTPKVNPAGLGRDHWLAMLERC